MKKICGDETPQGWYLPKCGHKPEDHYHYGCSLCICNLGGSKPAPEPDMEEAPSSV